MQARAHALIPSPGVLLLALGLALAIAPRAGAVPSPANSFVSPRIVICPAGDSVIVVVVRDLSNIPRFGDVVGLYSCDCPGLQLSTQPSTCTTADTSHCLVEMVSDIQGIVELPVSGGGLCPGGTLKVMADGMVLAIRSEPAVFDQDGNLRVDSADVAIVQAKVGGTDPSADFDGDGTVTAQDVAILQLHLGHAAPDAAPAAK